MECTRGVSWLEDEVKCLKVLEVSCEVGEDSK